MAFALSNAQLSVAVRAMHSNLANRWTVQELARLAGMSRSSFALKFKQIVGMSPLGYLTRWRMLVAADRFRNSGENIASIANALGYESATVSGRSIGFSRPWRSATRGRSSLRLSPPLPSCVTILGSSRSSRPQASPDRNLVESENTTEQNVGPVLDELRYEGYWTWRSQFTNLGLSP